MWFRTVTILVLFCWINTVYSINEDIERIVGGRNASIEEFPWQVSLVNVTNGRHFCGGFIIDRYRILTAAHCFQHNYTVKVRAGSTFLRGGYLRDIRRIIIHPAYDRDTVDNDITILILKYPLFFNERVQPVALPGFDYDLDAGEPLLISGWGKLNMRPESPIPDHLQAVQVQVVSLDSCIEAYNTSHREITDNMFCAGIDKVGGKDSCQGDSGGPVVNVYNGRPIVHGIVSWGRGCALPTHPGIYTRVSRFIQWIDSNQ